MTLGTYLKEYRARCLMTQKDLAKKLGISENYLCLIETNKKQVGIVVLKKIHAVTGADELTLFQLSKNKN